MITAPLSRALSRVLEWPLVGSLVAGIRATLTVDPAGDNNAVLYTAKTAGAAGNNISVAYATPATSAATTVAVVGDAVTVTPGTKAGMVLNNMTGAAANANGTYLWVSDYKWDHTSGDYRMQRDAIGAKYVVYNKSNGDVVADKPTSEWPESGTWVPYGAFTGFPSVIPRFSTAAQVIAAVNASAVPVTASNAPGNDGSGTVSAMLAANLTGGSDG